MANPIQSDSNQPRFLAYPYSVNGAGIPNTSGVDDHLRELILQVLFTVPGERVNLPFTEAYASRELTLPLYPSLSTKQVDQIAGTVVNFITDLTASF